MIRKMKDGRYRLYSRKKNPKTGKRRNLTGTARTKREAQALRARLLTQVDEGRRPATDATLAQLLERWLEMADLAWSTRVTYKGYIERTILPTLGHLLGDRTVGAVTIALAIHWMDRDTLFRAIRPLLRSGGGIAVVTNGTPLWLQDSEWSQTLAECLGQWTGKLPTGSCQTDEAGRRLNREALMSAGYRVVESAVDYDAELTIDEVVGGVFSAMSGDRMPPPQRREEFAAQVRDALARHEPLTEHVRVSLQFGHGP